MSERHKVRIIYKSGQAVLIRCTSFEVNRNGLGQIVSATWEDAKPRPLHLNLDAVESIWDVT